MRNTSPMARGNSPTPNGISICATSSNKKISRPSSPAVLPMHMHYDLWIRPSPFHTYSPEYFKGVPGMNCFSRNMYWDLGRGQIAEIGSHTMDLPWNAVDADLPVSAEAKGVPFTPDVTPVK